ncbi:hypothetical protein KRR26_30050 [Corallococcus sp. M34]|uniref:hypothetical protein n=1 Tax=Citreicoccus inhibens TaxID=2849499 RepID=UPI001C221530|nr:hypothetical protein [Citreicoccus inhibens]MBU8899862.1 hypothetical protein [Citreicoccus inhibens]
MADLLRQGAIPDRTPTSFWQATGLLVVTPYHDERFGSEPTEAPSSDEPIRMAYLHPLLAALKLPIDLNNVGLLRQGPAGTIHAISQGSHWMSQRGLERLIVIAADSYCDPLTLDWLMSARRIKTPEVPCGLMPGEAGACLLLETATSARRRNPPMCFPVLGAAVREEPCHFFSRKPNVGAMLAASLAEALGGTARREPFTGSIVSDLNGENWRATEWGYARVRLARSISDALHVMMPATSLGDTGTSSAMVSVCVAAMALRRGYARAEQILVVSSSERGHVGALRLSMKR